MEDRTTTPRNRTFGLSLPRRWIGDLLHFAQQIPTVPVQRVIDVSEAKSARAVLSKRPGWVPIFTKAFARMAETMPEFRRAYLGGLFPRMYEHAESIASVAMERDYEGEPGVFFAHMQNPAAQSLSQLDEHLSRFRVAPFDSVGCFRRLIRYAKLPLPIRRGLWWLGLNLNGRQRTKLFGTFGVSVYSGLGAESLHPISPLTTVLTYGPIDDVGKVTVRLVYDHRVMDGATVARGLAAIERIIQTELTQELREMSESNVKTAA